MPVDIIDEHRHVLGKAPGQCRACAAFTGALEPVAAKALYEQALAAIRAAGVIHVEAGEFAADMAVELVNDGPVTLLVEA